jgi:hypothetical protein
VEEVNQEAGGRGAAKPALPVRPGRFVSEEFAILLPSVREAEMERDLIRERTLDGLRAAEAQGRRGGRPVAVDEDVLAVARARSPAASRSPPSPSTRRSASSRCIGHCNRAREILNQLALLLIVLAGLGARATEWPVAIAS